MSECVLADYPSWIQALVSVGALGWCFGDTPLIRKRLPVLVFLRPRTPFLALTSGAPPGQIKGWVIQNQGLGPAVNATYSRCEGDKMDASFSRSIPPLGPGCAESVQGGLTTTPLKMRFEIDYESLSNRKYHTSVLVQGNRVTKTT
jgi:hypothetical protein